MSEWIHHDQDFDDPPTSVEELLRGAGEVPSPRFGLKAELITRAQRTQRDVRRQQMLWGGLVAVMLFFGGLIWWPASPGSALASNQESPQEPAATAPGSASDAVDWELVESKNQLRRRNLEIIRSAF